jgi:hypothetical protein
MPIREASAKPPPDTSVASRETDRFGKEPQQVIEISSSDESDSGEESGGDKPGAARTRRVIDLSHTEDEELAMVAVSHSLREDDGSETFPMVCRFFPEKGMQYKRLPGKKLPLRPYQLHGIWVNLMRCYVGLRAGDGKTHPCHGQIDSFDVGLGKTTTAFGLFPTPHLIDIARRMVIKDKASGQTRAQSGRYPSGSGIPFQQPRGDRVPVLKRLASRRQRHG